MGIKDIEKILIEGNLKNKKNNFKRGLYIQYSEENIPKYPILLLTCMDPRIDVHSIFNLKPGDIFILRNAGNIITKDMLRSIYIAISEFNIKFIIVLGHLDCGMTKLKMYELKSKLDMNLTQSELKDYFKPFADELVNISTQVQKLRQTRLISSRVEICGMLYDVNTGYVFESEIIERFQTIEDFNENYYDLVRIKQSLNNQEYVKETNSKKLKEQKSIKLEKEIENQLLSDSNEKIMAKQSNDILNENHLSEIKPLISKINTSYMKLPTIYFPKIKIHVPQIYKKKNQK